jgi:hypothetical protein
MELHLPPDPMTDLTDEELIDLFEENYFTLASTGCDAVNALAWDIAQGNFMEAHGLSDERMGKLLVLFARRMSLAWNTPAMDYYAQRRFSLMAGLVNDILGRK